MVLRIFGQRVKVKIVDGLIESRSAVGYYDPTNSIIAIDSSLDKQEFQTTLLHEVMHVIFCRLSIVQSIEPQLQEILCDVIAKALYENFILKNKK